ncbi:MAG: ATP-binding protein [Actinomycetota bacterium]
MLARDLKLPADVRSPAKARHALDDVRDHIPEEVLERFRLAVSELVTNVIVHAGLDPSDEFRMVVRVSKDRLRVEVVNPGQAFDPPTIAEAAPLAEAGRGLFLVDRTTDRWGVLPEDGVQLWFEIDLNAATARSY